MGNIRIINAKANNLKNVTIEIPMDKFTVMTGVSGSGKSSLVYDVLYKKARSIYLDSIGDRQHHFEDAVDSIKGLCPVVAVEQKIVRANSHRSVIGTRTNIFEYLRQLYASLGERDCMICGEKIRGINACKHCGNTPEPLPKGYFSFNTINGKCEVCEGRGFNWEPSLEKLTSQKGKSIKKVFWFWMFKEMFKEFCILENTFGINGEMCIDELTDQSKNAFLYGWGDFKGLIHYTESWVDYLMYKCPSAGPGLLERFYDRKPCASCNGLRLGRGPLAVRINGKSIGELSSMTMSELGDFMEELKIDSMLKEFDINLIDSIIRQLNGFRKVKLSYLSLYRTIPSLSGGEIQRLYIMRHLSSKLQSALYIFDEPTAGLHENEKLGLINDIKALGSGGNGIIVVEHDRNTIEIAEHIIDLGPLAGSEGGRVVYNGDIEGIYSCEDSLTGKYLSGIQSIPSKSLREYRKVDESGTFLRIKNAVLNNLKNIDVDIPLGRIVGISGVSGSGKSTLVSKVLIPLLHYYFKEIDEGEEPIEIEDMDEGINDEDIVTLDGNTLLYGIEELDGYADVVQIPISRYGTSTPMSYLGLWESVRKIYAREPEARKKKFTASHFSFNSSGACPECKGKGVLKRTHFQEEAFTLCGSCKGKRFREDVLEIKVKGKNIHELQSMSITEALDFFSEEKKICSMLKTLHSTGLGYMALGQPIPTLSGGEAQRLKIAKELGAKRKGRILYILDEPTTGLSFHDIANLLPLLERLIASGNSVLVIEHDPSVLSYCDYIIEMGPGAGVEGGHIIAKGSPYELSKNRDSCIGKYLKGEW